MAHRKQSPSQSNSSSANASFIPVMASPIPAPRSSTSSRGTLPSSFGLGLPQFGLRRIASSANQNSSGSKIPQSPTSASSSPTATSSVVSYPRAATIAIGRGASNPVPTSPASPSSSASSLVHPSAPNGKPLVASGSSTSGSSIPKFRSLRNILPFGPKSTPTPSPQDPSGGTLSLLKNSSQSTSPSPTPLSSSVNLAHRRSASSIPGTSHTSEMQTPQKQATGKPNFLGFASRSSFSINGADRKSSAPTPNAYASASMSAINRRRSEDPGMGYRPIPPIPAMPALCQPVISIEGPSEASNSGGSKDKNDTQLTQVTEDGKLKDRHFGLGFGLRRSVSASATAASVNASASLTVSPSGNNDARLGVDGLNATDALSRSLSSLGLPLPGVGSGFAPGLLRTPKSSKGADVKGSPGSGSMSASSSPGASLRVHDDGHSRSPGSPRQGSLASLGSSHGLGGPSGPGDLSTIMESELSSMSITKHIPPLDEENENVDNVRADVDDVGNSPINIKSSNANQDDSDAEDEEDEDGTLVLANLAKEVHARSVKMMKAESLETGPLSASSDDGAPPPVPGKDFPRLGAFHERESSNSSSSRSEGLVFRNGVDFITIGHERVPSNPLLTPSTATSASSPAFAPMPVTPTAPDIDTSPLVRDGKSTGNTPDEGAQLRSLLRVGGELGGGQVDESFDLSSLDADLANLLSPNKFMPQQQQSSALRNVVAAVDSITPPPPMSTPSNSQSSGSARSEEESPVTSKRKKSQRRTVSATVPPDEVDSKGGRTERPRSFTAVLGQQSSPKRPTHSRPTSLTISTSSVTSPDTRRGSLDIPATRTRHRPTTSRDGEDVSSPLDDAPQAHLEGPYSALGITSPGASFASSESLAKRRAHIPRLHTPNRQHMPSNEVPGSSSRPGSSFSVRPALKNWRRTQVEAGYDQNDDLVSTPVPRTGSTLGASVLRRPSVTHTERAHQRASLHSRHRKRSMSVNETRPPSSLQKRSPGEWLGPRTVRLFRNAGLLDDPDKQPPPRDRDGAVSVTSSRTESRLRLHTRSSMDQERPLERSLYTPSRAGYSDVTRASSWGRGSIAGSMTMAELTMSRVDSPITTITSSTTPTSSSNPKTTFSGSTATSVSGGSPSQPSTHSQFHFEASITSLREKHQLEMEALLNALADSQRSGKSLREENAMLRGRIRDLEEQIRDLVEKLNVSPTLIPSSSTLSTLHRSILGNTSRPGSTEPVQRRHSRMQSYVLGDSTSALDRSEAELDSSLLTMRQPTPLSSLRSSPRMGRFEGSSSLAPSEHTARKRSSTASSIFPVVPSNMSMLLHDDTDAGEGFANSTFASYKMHVTGSTPSSPSVVLARPTPVNPANKSRHAPKQSVSSIGSNSSTNPDVSILSLPGSPGSLNLRPEHERHLGDMISLDFSLGGESDG